MLEWSELARVKLIGQSFRAVVLPADYRLQVEIQHILSMERDAFEIDGCSLHQSLDQ